MAALYACNELGACGLTNEAVWLVAVVFGLSFAFFMERLQDYLRRKEA